MDYFDYVVIGSGPSGVSATRTLLENSRNTVCMVDVGESLKSRFQHNNLQLALQNNDVPGLLGQNFESLANIVFPQNMHPKIRSQDLRYVLNGEAFKVLNGAGNILVNGAGSHATGGLSNIWGGQLIRYTAKDLTLMGDWPIDISLLEPYYLQLEDHIGISGESDDMDEFLGNSLISNPPIPLVPSADRLYKSYRRHSVTHPDRRLLMGRPRLALLTDTYRNYPAHEFGEKEFFTAGITGIYTAQRTLLELINNDRFTYLSGFKFLSWDERDDYVEITICEIESGNFRVIRARHLLLGCGTIQTARLVLINNNAQKRSLPFIDHPPTLLPLFIPNMFGTALPLNSYPIQLIGTLTGSAQRDMISFYYPGGLLWSDLVPDIPLPMNISLKVIGSLLGGMLVAQIWNASTPSSSNQLYLTAENEIEINYRDISSDFDLTLLIRELRRLGVFSMKRFVTQHPPGWGFHHAGCLPMRSSPGEFETYIDGRLWNSRRVRVIDGSVLPSLPAKNHSLTVMANASRIADEVIKCGF